MEDEGNMRLRGPILIGTKEHPTGKFVAVA